MNLLVICADTFRADYLGCYGNDWIKTPNLDALAKKSVVFTNVYAEGLPTLQCRTVFFTGHRIVPNWRVKRHKGDWILSQQPGWHPLDDDEVVISEVLGDQGYTTALITDTLPMIQPGLNFNRGFDSWQWIRGQARDNYITGPRKRTSQSKLSYRERYFLNTMYIKTEEDYFVAQVMLTAARWLKNNTMNKPFFLWVDCFDPHEPWDPPDEYARMYYSKYKGSRLIFGKGSKLSNYSDEEFKHVKALYAGEVTLVDKWVGYLLDIAKKLELEKDTIIVFVSDHGTILGEHGYVHKQHHLLIKPETRLPLIIFHPDREFQGERIDEFVQAQDLMPTLLSLLDVSLPSKADGKNAWKIVTGEAEKLYEYVISAFGNHISIRNKHWNYITPYIHPDIKRVESRWALPMFFCHQLYDLKADPKEERNVIEKKPNMVEEMRKKLIEYGIHRFPEIVKTDKSYGGIEI